MSDEIILLDFYDNIIGYDTKENSHREGKLHRAFSIVLFYEDRILIQKIAKSKYHSGGLWSNTCCSYPDLQDKIMKIHELNISKEDKEMLLEIAFDINYSRHTNN